MQSFNCCAEPHFPPLWSGGYKPVCSITMRVRCSDTCSPGGQVKEGFWSPAVLSNTSATSRGAGVLRKVTYHL